MILTGRTKIFTDEKYINQSNIVQILRKAYTKHCKNVKEIQFLTNYERGIQPLQRSKTIRPDINIEAIDNMASYVKNFKVGYIWGTPVTLIQRSDKDINGNPDKDDSGISILNEMLRNGNRIGQLDQQLGESVETTGIGHRMVDIKTDFSFEYNNTFVDIYTLDSNYAFCVYYNGIGQKKALGVTYSKSSSGKLAFTCFTDEERFEITGWEVVEQQINPLGMIPIIEYERSFDRMGCFERQIPLMDSLNIMVSDFSNDVSQRTQEIWWGNDIDFPKDPNTGETIKPKSGQWLVTYSGEGKNPKIQPLSNTFESTGTLSGINSTRNEILKKCYVPMQSDSQGGGSTGVAMDMSSGWSATEVDANREEQLIDGAKREELELILRAIRFVDSKYLPEDSPLRSIRSNDIDFHFNRRKNYDMSIKANTFATYVAHGVHGRHALKVIDAFPDAEQVWIDSKELIQEYQEKQFGKEESTDLIMSDNSDQIGNSPILDGMNTDNTTVRN